MEKVETFCDKTDCFDITYLWKKLGKSIGKNVKIENFLGKFYRYIGRHMKTMRNKWKKELETFSD